MGKEIDVKQDKKFKDFAFKHGLIFEPKGQVGFGRECVGFLAKGGSYIDFDPWLYDDEIAVFTNDEDWEWCPSSVADAYHKHDCMAVLVQDEDYQTALNQLELWVDHLENVNVKVVQYKTGAKGMQAMVNGVIGYAFRRVEDCEKEKLALS